MSSLVYCIPAPTALSHQPLSLISPPPFVKLLLYELPRSFQPLRGLQSLEPLSLSSSGGNQRDSTCNRGELGNFSNGTPLWGCMVQVKNMVSGAYWWLPSQKWAPSEIQPSYCKVLRAEDATWNKLQVPRHVIFGNPPSVEHGTKWKSFWKSNLLKYKIQYRS